MRTALVTTLASTLLAAALVPAGLTGCASEADEGDPEDGIFVDDGKEDDFLSLSAQEYLIEGTTSITLTGADAALTGAARDARVRELVGYKQIAIAWFLTQYLVAKEADSPNHAFGGFGGIAKAGAFEDLQVRATGANTYEFKFRQLAAGTRELLSLLPLRSAGGGQVFDLEVGRPSNEELGRLETNNEWYRQAPWDGWNPANVPAAQKEALTFAIKPERASPDAWLDVKRLIADGVLDIDVHMGWDYHAAFHVQHARALFGWLQDQGFRAPVAGFDALTRTSGDFTKRISADGRPLTVKVRLFYGKTGSDTDPDTDAGGIQLENDMRASLKTRDVIVYSGHSGPFYGFALGNWRKTSEGDLDDTDMRSADMPADRYQVILAEGCDTYQIGQAFKDNPSKAGKNVDVITSTSFSNASTPDTVQDFISSLIERDSAGKLRPRTMKALLTDLDSNSPWFHTMYGIHGIDDNPTLHPFAVTANIGKTCRVNADCGGIGNLCVATGAAGGGKACTAACSADAGCPTTHACKPVASSSSRTIYANACRKR